MKKHFSRMISACAALSLCLGMVLLPASAADTELGSVTINGVTFSVTGESLSIGSQLTAGPSDTMEVDHIWTLTIHLTKDGEDRYAAVTYPGEMTDFFAFDENEESLNGYLGLSYLDNAAWESVTFSLTIPEEYADWDVAIRFGYYSGSAEIPVESAKEKPIDDGGEVPISFSDVNEGDWYYNFVIPAANAGWFSGNPDGSFGPNDPLTVAQVIVLAARLHAAQSGVDIPAAAEDEAWYMPYQKYCVEQGILVEGGYLDQMDEAATRFDMIAIWDSAAYPPRVNAAVNEVADGFIPDLAETDPYGEVVYRWYRSGVLTGDSQYRFNGESSITRAEASVILCHLTALVETAKL